MPLYLTTLRLIDNKIKTKSRYNLDNYQLNEGDLKTVLNNHGTFNLIVTGTMLQERKGKKLKTVRIA